MIELKKYGWTDFFESQLSEYSGDELLAGRVAIENKSNYMLYTEFGEYSGELSGKFYYDAESRGGLPAVGDWVMFKPVHNEKKAVIENVLTRKNKFSRKVVLDKTDEQIIAANIDYLFIVTSFNLEFNLKRIERYLTMAYDNELKPVIILSKEDLCEDPSGIISEVRSISGGTDIHPVSAIEEKGLDILRKYLEGNLTAAVVGSSGVGKSTLINVLTGTNNIPVNVIGDYKDKGKHTTTKREMILLPEGGIIIDTPGMREIQIWEGSEGLSDSFKDVEDYFTECRFSDCKHDTEPGCAVKKAIENGELEEERFNNYVKLQKEIKWFEIRKDKKAKSEESKKWKKASLEYRKRKK
ncbi:MAG TPA: ribosome small subunit-dependent GTPase A [Ignavibacteria bacterium]|nr:ribosome small subunit-dependent GTPase A [Ignavibacteria bacterium]HMR40794.1 ribosome small subunit-dependent GTPase A [Ignavibacteria bacterium]